MQRLQGFADAVGVLDSEPSFPDEIYSAELVEIAGEDIAWLELVETTFKRIVEGDKQKHVFDVERRFERLLLHELAEHYNLESDSRGREPYRRVLVTRRVGGPPARVPRPTLSQALAKKEERRQRQETINEIRRVWICLDQGQGMTNELIHRTIDGFLRAHSGFYEIIRKTPDPLRPDSMDVLVQLSSRQRLEAACASLPGLRLRQCVHPNEGGDPESSSSRAPSTWDDDTDRALRNMTLKPEPPNSEVPEDWTERAY